MNIKATEKWMGESPKTPREFYIVGPRKLQNQLISYYLAREIGARCLVCESIHQVVVDAASDEQARLLVVDCQETAPEELLMELEACPAEALSRVNFILLNIVRGLGFEENLIWKGVRGFLYEEDPLDWLKEGILAVLDGEIWLSRKMFLQCLLEGRTTDYSYRERISSLTAREAEVLALVATWASNQEIAERLCISSHTVKTHLYNIFKKIDVSDRRQAALWALKNLERITTRR